MLIGHFEEASPLKPNVLFLRPRENLRRRRRSKSKPDGRGRHHLASAEPEEAGRSDVRALGVGENLRGEGRCGLWVGTGALAQRLPLLPFRFLGPLPRRSVRPDSKMAVESRVTQEEIKKEPEKPIDREKTCPLLLRVFTTNNGRHHRMDEFARGNVPSSELQIYTWMDATLKELTSLVKEVYPEARKKGTHFNFAIVFTDLKRPGYRVKEIGSTMSGRKGTDDSMTLQSQKFQIGDYLDIAITPPNRAPPPSGRMRPY
ncbi:histone deacetylase complex subunit SAP18 [Lacerta agilis]|nr:histone deacetylase complex subunit SAP18 [Lacerta agilis]